MLSIDHPEVRDHLPEGMLPWVRTATRFGAYLANRSLRARDVIEIDEPEDIFAPSPFDVTVPAELNPAIDETISVPQTLFRLGTAELPGKEQIVTLPIRADALES